MGVFDKIKNALFEVEYVEVEEPPKKEKKGKKKEVEEEKPIAKRVVLPGKREERVEELKEEELLDEDFEIRPVEEEKPRDQFKFMDDNDFKVDEEPEFLEEKKEEPEIIDERPIYGGFKEEVSEEVYTPITTYNNPNYRSSSETNLYGMNSHSSYDVPVHQYGTYEKSEKTYFKPSPIISPIYGILDKNYKKEDVKEKKEIRLTGYTRSNVNVDDIRAKAYGREKETEPEVEENIFEIENDASENVMVDLSDRSKPEVKELTMGDAEEYFEDLGLEYNVDYVDVSTDRSKIKKEEPVVEEKVEAPIDLNEVEEEPVEEKVEDVKIEVEKETEPDDDNLFDLIDSMYEDNE
ncbi:MAG: hypothetical protein IK137_02650 [Bacilli bacterium]|nr:hypothetical protein [Bacilli bacterium]